MKIIGFALAVLAVISVTAGIFYNFVLPPPHFHAGFKVYVNGRFQDYSDNKYMHIDACAVNSSGQRPLKARDRVHLHDNIGDVVHVHDNGVVWGLLFSNMGVRFPSGMPVSGFVNGKAVDKILDTVIQKNDSAIIIVGSKNGINTNKYVSLGHIKEIEAKKESCGT